MILSLYLLGFFYYHLTPLSYFHHINYSPFKPIPIPYQKPCKVVLGVKSALDGGVGQPNRLERYLKEKSVSFSLGHSMNYSERIREGPVQEGYGYDDLGVSKLFLYILFEYIPKKLVFFNPEDYYGLLKPKECKPVISNLPVLVSTPLGELPSYSFILGSRWNLAYPDCDNMESFILVVGKDISLSVYNPPNFYPPGKLTLSQAILNLQVKQKSVLVLVYKDKELWEVYDQSMITLPLREKGSYELKIYSYKLKAFNLYFGLRFLSCTPEINIQAM